MAHLPSKLDDGDLFLPSDMHASGWTAAAAPSRGGGQLDMDALTQHLAFLSLLQRSHASSKLHFPVTSSSESQRFGTGTRNGYGRAGKTFQPWCFEVNAGIEDDRRSFHGHRTGPHFASPRRGPEYQATNLTQPKVESHLENNARTLHRPRTRSLLQNRLLPFQGSEFRKSVGCIRESGGTGVFHPRVLDLNSSVTNRGRKREGSRNRQQTEISKERNSIRRLGISVQEECYFHLPPELGLPQDWTY